jgi:hydroxymethylbilane synthase
MTTIRFGSRGSALARWQTDWVAARLQEAWPGLECQIKIFTTTGDKTLDKPLTEMGGKGVFTQELEQALHAGEIDVAVHSLKDLPVEDTVGLKLGAISERADARDVLVSPLYRTLANLPQGAKVGTCSLRRTAQLLTVRPDLTILPVRGNVDTRLRKVTAGDYDAIVLAAAGVLRLDLGKQITEYLSFETMLPAPGQAALAAQCRVEDSETLKLLAVVDHKATRQAVTAERSFLQALGGGCLTPVAAYATANTEGEINLTGLVASGDGQRVIRVKGEGHDPTGLGEAVARQALAQGAGELLG